MSTDMVKRIERLSRVPIADLTPGDLRLLVSQGVRLEMAVPAALALLREDPLLEADYYPGDLTAALAGVGDGYWNYHQDEAQELRRIAGEAAEAAR